MKIFSRTMAALSVGMLISACTLASGDEVPRPGGDGREATASAPAVRQAEVVPACAEPGEEVALTVRAEPGAPVLFVATYSDGLSGSPEPMGAGYGGNDGGFADADGVYRSSWVVSAEAPAGPVTVGVALPGDDHGHDGGAGHVHGSEGDHVHEPEDDHVHEPEDGHVHPPEGGPVHESEASNLDATDLTVGFEVADESGSC